MKPKIAKGRFTHLNGEEFDKHVEVTDSGFTHSGHGVDMRYGTEVFELGSI